MKLTAPPTTSNRFPAGKRPANGFPNGLKSWLLARCEPGGCVVLGGPTVRTSALRGASGRMMACGPGLSSSSARTEWCCSGTAGRATVRCEGPVPAALLCAAMHRPHGDSFSA
jgi:hypothetical protein